MDRFLMDRVVFIPSAVPPHKQPDNLADAAHRIRMTRDATSGSPGFSVSGIELDRIGPSYTIDTVQHYRRVSSPDSQLFFILGIDAFLEIDTWKSYQDLLAMIPFVVITRPGTGCPAPSGNREAIGAFLREHIPDDYRWDASESAFLCSAHRPVYMYRVTPMAISSTTIRQYVRKGWSISSLVTEDVEAYINAKGLYR